MLEDDLFALIDPVLKPLGHALEDGEEFREPPLDVLRYHRRPVRLNWVPVLGRASSVVAVARQPVDIGFSRDGYRAFLDRLARAVNGRFPPARRGLGLGIGLTVLVLTPEPIRPEDDATLATAFAGLARMRVVTLGLLRVNLGQEAMAFALAQDPLYPEPAALADALTPHLKRFVPLIDV